MQTRITERYGIAFPLVAAPLGAVSSPALVAAVSNAGGLGTLSPAGAPGSTPRELSGRIAAVRRLTGRPFAVNLVPAPATDELIAVCIAARVPVVSFHRSDVPAACYERLHGAGLAAWVQVGSVAEAERAAAAGADALVVHGREAGDSNRGAGGTMALVPAVVDAVAPVPVLAAGGIADGRGVAAALALGADAAWVGTRFVASREAGAHEAHRRRVGAASVPDTLPAAEIVRTMMAEAERVIVGRLGATVGMVARPWDNGY